MLGKPMPPILLLMAIVAMVVLNRVWAAGQWIALPWTLVGLVPILAGVGVAVWSAVLFRRGGTTIRPGFESSALVTAGPFRISRNPIYLGMVLTLVGIGVLMGSAPPAAGRAGVRPDDPPDVRSDGTADAERDVRR